MSGKDALRKAAMGERRARLAAIDAAGGGRPRIGGAGVARALRLAGLGGAPHTAGLAPIVASFAPLGSEPDVTPLEEACRAAGARIIFPSMDGPAAPGDVAVTASGRRLAVDWAEDGERLGAAILGSARLVIVPALLVDARGARLGRGAGWYDRALARRAPRTWLLGLVWPWEVVEGPLPSGAHDVRLDAVLTADGLRPLGARAAERLARPA